MIPLYEPAQIRAEIERNEKISLPLLYRLCALRSRNTALRRRLAFLEAGGEYPVPGVVTATAQSLGQVLEKVRKEESSC